MFKNNCYILTEERPKPKTIEFICKMIDKDVKIQNLEIIPNIKNGRFDNLYFISGLKSKKIKNFYIKIVSGSSSFIDFLVFIQKQEPINGDLSNLKFVIEETKTFDEESRNTGVYQRGSKFVYLDIYKSNVKKLMYYDNIETLNQEKQPTDTNIFGTNMLLTVGIEIPGKSLKWFKKFENIDELINFKDSMSAPPAGNIPITIKKDNDKIFVSGRLSKPQDEGNIAHDPNIGAISLICKTLRTLGWNNEIIITNHGVSREYIEKTKGKNKFLYICKLLNIKLDGINIIYSSEWPDAYWKYEDSSEKITSIFTHVLAINHGFIGIYENHAGCERGYFYNKDNNQFTIPKKDENGINLYIPDLILANDSEKIILLIEGKKLSTLNIGLEEINNYDSIEKQYIKKYFPEYKIERWITTYGGNIEEIPNIKVLIHINSNGKIIINEKAPECFKNIFNSIHS